MLRVITAVILLPFLWVAIKIAPPWVFNSVAALAISLAVLECHTMLGQRGARPFSWLGMAATWGVIGSYLSAEAWFGPALPLALATMLTLVLAMWLRENPKQMLDTAFKTLFPVLFVGLGLSYLVRLRGMPGEDGKDLLMLLFLCVMAADTFAFYAGTHFGRHRMAPRLSPKKSWEGAAAGMVGSVVAALIAHFWFYQRLPLEHAVALGLVLGAAGIFGDLAESVIKRAAEVKDSSRLLPGHGGLMDRTDSLLFAGPILYYYYLAFLRGAAVS